MEEKYQYYRDVAIIRYNKRSSMLVNQRGDSPSINDGSSPTQNGGSNMQVANDI